MKYILLLFELHLLLSLDTLLFFISTAQRYNICLSTASQFSPGPQEQGCREGMLLEGCNVKDKDKGHISKCLLKYAYKPKVY
jgi:hypothetical protein